MEFLIDLFFGLFFEIEGVFKRYLRLMCSAIPERLLGGKNAAKIKNVVEVYSAILMVAILVGLILIVCADGHSLPETLGQCLTFIPLALIGVQIALGVLSGSYRL